MLTGFRDLYSPPNRKTDATDVRMAIRRHDPEYQRNPRDRRHYEELGIEADDSMDVSTVALQIFLENFIKGQEGEVTEEASLDQAPVSPQEEAVPVPSSREPHSRAARAAYAYRSQAMRSQAQEDLPYGTDHVRGATAEAQHLLHGADVRIIYSLIKDLEDLRARGIKTIRIEYGHNFLASLVSAVNHIRHPEHYHKN